MIQVRYVIRGKAYVKKIPNEDVIHFVNKILKTSESVEIIDVDAETGESILYRQTPEYEEQFDQWVREWLSEKNGRRNKKTGRRI